MASPDGASTRANWVDSVPMGGWGRAGGPIRETSQRRSAWSIRLRPGTVAAGVPTRGPRFAFAGHCADHIPSSSWSQKGLDFDRPRMTGRNLASTINMGRIMSDKIRTEGIRGQLSDTVLAFCQTLRRLVIAGKRYQELPADFWDPLKAFIAVDEFQRCSQDYSVIVGDNEDGAQTYDSKPFTSDVLTWSEWSHVAGEWCLSPSLWDYTVMRIAEFTSAGIPGVVYLELEERGAFRGEEDDRHWSNTISLYEFNDEGKLRRIRLGVADYALRAWPTSSTSTAVTAAG
jgi:hypothetical protein